MNESRPKLSPPAGHPVFCVAPTSLALAAHSKNVGERLPGGHWGPGLCRVPSTERLFLQSVLSWTFGALVACGLWPLWWGFPVNGWSDLGPFCGCERSALKLYMHTQWVGVTSTALCPHLGTETLCPLLWKESQREQSNTLILFLVFSSVSAFVKIVSFTRENNAISL